MNSIIPDILQIRMEHGVEYGDGSCVAFYFVYATQEPSPYSICYSFQVFQAFSDFSRIRH